MRNVIAIMMALLISCGAWAANQPGASYVFSLGFKDSTTPSGYTIGSIYYDNAAANTTVTITNPDGTYKANLSVENNITGGGILTMGSGAVALTNATGNILSAAFADAANIGMLNEAEIIAGNWVNTTNPWADNEVSDTLTASLFVGSGSTTTAVDLATAEVAGGLTADKGGTGQAGGYAVGDLLYASSATALSKLADVATGQVLLSGGVATAPAWGALTDTLVPNDLTIASTAAATFSNSGTPITMTRTTAATNTYVSVGINRLTSSANMADGFGVGYNFQYADDTSGTLAAGGIGFVRDGADNQTKAVIQTMVAGTQTTEFQLSSTACTITPSTTITGDLTVSGNNVVATTHEGAVDGSVILQADTLASVVIDADNDGTEYWQVMKNGILGTQVAKIDEDGNFKLPLVGGGLYLKEGTNATMGTVTLAGGTATASTTKASATMRVILSHQAGGGTSGELTLGTITAGTSFVINSSDGADTGTVLWIIVEPA